MPTPNQPTPDSPERVRGETPDIATNVRQFDLVRCMRSELHAAELITDDEFNWLCAVAPMAQGKPGQGSISRQRIEDYDTIRSETTRLAEALKEALPEIDWIARNGWLPMGTVGENSRLAYDAHCIASAVATKLRAALTAAPISGAKKE